MGNKSESINNLKYIEKNIKNNNSASYWTDTEKLRLVVCPVVWARLVSHKSQQGQNLRFKHVWSEERIYEQKDTIKEQVTHDLSCIHFLPMADVVQIQM